MPFIRNYTSRESIYTSGIQARATPEQMGAGIGRALGGMADAFGDLGAAVATQQRKREADDAVGHVATFDYTKPMLDRQSAAPPGAPGFYKETSGDYKAAVQAHVAPIQNSRLRKMVSDELMSRMPAQMAAAARFEVQEAAGYSHNVANDGLLAIQSRIRSNPNDWTTAASDSDALIDRQTHIPASEREKMKNDQHQNLTRWRFEALVSAADTPEALGGIEKDVNSGRWDTVFNPADKARILDGIESARKVLNTEADTVAREALGRLTPRDAAGQILDPGEMQSVHELIQKSGNPSLLWDYNNIVAHQQVYQAEGRMPASEIEAKRNAANGGPGLAYPSLPAELNSAVNDASAFTNGRVSASFLASMAVREYGEHLGQPARGNAEFAPSSVHEGVDLRNISPATLDAATVAGEIFGRPLPITSGYRSASKQAGLRSANAAAAAAGRIAKHSHHTAGNALDISTAGMNNTEKARAVDALVQAGFTGFGEYAGHIHADMRDAVPASYGEREGKMWGGWTYLSPEVGDVLNRAGFKAGMPASAAARGTRAVPVADIDWGHGNTGGKSDAVGVFQFIPGTWLDIARREEFADVFGVTPETSDADVLALRADPKLSTIAAALYAEENKKIVEDTIGRGITDAELYMAHFFGAGGAIAFLSAYKTRPEALASSVLRQAAEANPNVFRNDSGPLTVSEVYGNITASFNGHPSAIAHAGNEARQKLIDRERKAFEEGDPVSHMVQSGVRNVGRLDNEEAWQQRGRDARYGSEYYQVPDEDFPPFTKDEAAILGKQIKEGNADETLALMTQMQAMGDEVARAGYKQLEQEDAVFAYAAEQAQDGNSQVAADIIRGQKRLEENTDLKKLFGEADTVSSFNAVAGKALLGLPSATAQAIREAALAHYTETYLARGAGNMDDGTIEPNAFNRSINAVLGGKPGAPAIGNVNGAMTLLPRGMTEDQVDDALTRMTIEDYTAVSIDGNPPRYIDGDIVDPEDISTEGKMHFVGTDAYQIQMADGNWLVSDAEQTGRIVPYTMQFTAKFGLEVLARPTDDLGYTPPPARGGRGSGRGSGSMRMRVRPGQPITTLGRNAPAP